MTWVSRVVVLSLLLSLLPSGISPAVAASGVPAGDGGVVASVAAVSSFEAALSEAVAGASKGLEDVPAVSFGSQPVWPTDVLFGL